MVGVPSSRLVGGQEQGRPIGTQSFFSGLMLRWLDWREIYQLLVFPGLFLAAAIAYLLQGERFGPPKPSAGLAVDAPGSTDDVQGQLIPFYLLCVVSAI